jgi:hypothetical protein
MAPAALPHADGGIYITATGSPRATTLPPRLSRDKEPGEGVSGPAM